MDKLIVLPKLLKGSDWSEQTKKAERIIQQYYIKDILLPQKKISDVKNTILNSKYKQKFMDSMQQLKTEKLYKSNIHGQAHVERVCILAAYLAIQMKVNEHMFTLCMEAAKYHDIGRCDDSEDKFHGYRGSKDIKECCKGFSEWECEMIATVVEAHSLLDEEAGQVFDKYGLLNPLDFEMYLQMLYILKDADALDRFRLTEHSLSVKFLRIPESVCVIQAACEINQILIDEKL